MIGERTGDLLSLLGVGHRAQANQEHASVGVAEAKVPKPRLGFPLLGAT